MRIILEVLGPVIFSGIGYLIADWVGAIIALFIYILLRCGALDALAGMFD